MSISYSIVIVISTHSLTRRLTSILSCIFSHLTISTHSLTRRLTPHQQNVSIGLDNFNSQPHKEADWHLQIQP